MEVAESLWNQGATYPKISKEKFSKNLPSKDIRFNNSGELPSYTEKQELCKMENCNTFSSIECKKCSVTLSEEKQKLVHSLSLKVVDMFL